MKRIILRIICLLTVAILYNCVSKEESQLGSDKPLSNGHSLPKPLLLDKNKSSRQENGISYGFDLYGYQYSTLNGGNYTKQFTVWVSNNTGSPQNIRFSINSFDNYRGCVRVSSVDGITGGGYSAQSGEYKIVWRPGNNFQVQPGEYCTTTFTLIIYRPFGCVEGSYVMEMNTPFTTNSNFTDDYVYLIQ